MSKAQVRKQGHQTWGVYVDDELIEGGFFNKDYAQTCANEWNEEHEEHEDQTTKGESK